MPAYTFEALDAQGRSRKGVLEAETARAARTALRGQGLVPLQVEAVGAADAAAGGAAGAGRREIVGAFRDVLVPAADAFRPELVLVSAGFDSRIDDPLGGFRLTDDDFAELTGIVQGIAARHAAGRLVSTLEGGYNLAGLAAALLKRGLDFVQIPTTLLAQVDSSVGGKTAINAAAGKNLVGVFHQPRLVLADLGVLATLPVRERRAGYAEIVKIGLIHDATFYEWCEQNGAAVISENGAALAHAVETAVKAKAAIVAADEREAGVRALLNLGHTFAHAIEAEAGMDGAVLHGEAVGCGMALAFRFSAQLGLCDAANSVRVDAHLAEAGFATRLRELPVGGYTPARMIEAMHHDKKNEGGALTFILARGVGKAFVARNVDGVALGDFLAEHA
jgi:3-dehydroquinate synthetase